jgi:hypothetical protein
MLWRPANASAEIKSLMAFLVSQQVSRVRVRYSLKGRTLWKQSGSHRVYVDGHALGAPGFRTDGTPRIDLQLPSGDRRRASDFDSWFYIQLQIPPSNLVGLSLSAPAVLAGGSLSGTVTLDFPAPANGLPIKVTSSAPQVTVQQPVTVTAGTTTAPFTITTAAQITGSMNVLITASAGNVNLTAQLTVQVISVAISPTGMSLSAGHSQQFTAVVGGTTDQTVTWTVQEPGGGSVTATGFYTAPGTGGTFHVAATSTVDTSKKASATITVVAKGKEKEKEKEKEHKDKEIVKEHKDIEKHATLDALVPAMRPILLPGSDGPSAFEQPSIGRAFIRPAERPLTTPVVDGGAP